MIHYGDITAISGYNIPPVDVVCGGSPCQDLSIAGKREGLSGKRSGLFMEQIRVVKELRDADIQRGRTGNLVRPRFMLWENVPGAFSSNAGKDFQIVLTECVRVVEPDAPDIPCPKKWPLADAYYGDGWSIAYRVLDAQFWGVPQRRRRIALVCDFGGQSAGEILFVRESVSGHFAESGTPGKGTAGAVETCAYPAVARSLTARMDGSPCIDRGPEIIVQNGVKCFNPWGSQSGRVYDADGVWHSLNANETGGMQRDAVLTEPIPINTMIATRHKALGRGTGFGVGAPGDPAFTISAAHSHGVAVYDARGNGDGKTVCTLTGDHQNRVTDYTALCVGNGQLNQISMSEQANTLDAMHDQQSILVAAVDCRNGTESKINGTLQAKPSGGYSLNTNNTIRQEHIVRRLTPLECERLQGYPDGWTDIGDYIDSSGRGRKTSDSARYKALGNSIALPPWKWVLKRISSQYERDATMGSLFDGIGGFPLIWERLNGRGTALWASEIEEFCIAVTKRRFSGGERHERQIPGNL